MVSGHLQVGWYQAKKMAPIEHNYVISSTLYHLLWFMRCMFSDRLHTHGWEATGEMIDCRSHRFDSSLVFNPGTAGLRNWLTGIIELPQKQTPICHNHCKSTYQITDETGYNENLSEETMINRLPIRTIPFQNDGPYDDSPRPDIMVDDGCLW